jgi:hypothetical protein
MRWPFAKLIAGVVLGPLSACMLANNSADKKIGDVVHNLNDQARWGRLDDAAALVQPDYREAFLERHRLWGSEIQLADSEVVNIQLTSKADQANAVVTYSWYGTRDMTLHETTLRQLWSTRSSTYALASELVVRGDPGLFSAPEQAHSTRSQP